MVAYLIVDKVAEGFLDLIDALQEEIDELEDHIDEWTNAQDPQRMTTLRRDMLQIRRTLSPTPGRRAARGGQPRRADDAEELFPRRRRAALRRRLRQAPALHGGPGHRARLDRRHARLPPGQGRPRPERDHEGADDRRGDLPATDVHRRRVRPELRPHARAALAARLPVFVGRDRRGHGRAADVLPAQGVDRRTGAPRAAGRLPSLDTGRPAKSGMLPCFAAGAARAWSRSGAGP